MSETDNDTRTDDEMAAQLGPGPVARMRCIPDPNPDLPVGGLLGDVPLVGMLEIESDGSSAGTKVSVNGTPIRMLQEINFSVSAEKNMVLVELVGYTKELKLRGAIVEVKQYDVQDDGSTEDVETEPAERTEHEGGV